MKIEFFHDVICSFCFPMSYRMRQIKALYPEADIIHRPFALAFTSRDLATMFGSHEEAKQSILSHWAHANQNDDLHRFNIEGMTQQSFLFPTSKKPLIAVKAAELIGGHDLAWDAFDALQHALFVKNENISDDTVIKQTMGSLNLPLTTWEDYFYSPDTIQLVLDDLQIAHNYGITSVPFIVINEEYTLNGAQPLTVIQQTLDKIHSIESSNNQTFEIAEGDTCKITKEGAWTCD